MIAKRPALKVSVIMCAFNVAPFIASAIETIKAQTYQDWELIIADDASTDDTLAIARSFAFDPRIKVYAHQRNMGYIKNKNWAFQQANGDLLTQLDADDLCGEDRLASQVEVFYKHPEVMICGTNYQMVDQNGRYLWSREFASDQHIYLNEEQYPFWFPSLMFRKELIAEVGLFSEYFEGVYGDDHHWTMRVNQKYPVYFIKEVLYSYRANPNSITNVFDNPRKLLVADILKELRRQCIAYGTDSIQQGYFDKMLDFEKALLGNRSKMSEHYRTWAAKAIDKKRFGEAWSLLKKAILANPYNLNNYRTVFYLFKNF
ncbi:Glycosyl transferase family 2 [Cnuella takakiae]|uniref:Glycosyl transferase family 2 n=1 Tax=Cnuella takakiae TaxID=1302690 RepID=A0A1M5DRI2_9BACT|nr:glycosyltransferase family 2 protein [Cnuella takakiae]OLY93894.1 hypothetical protein BUE76_19920 [Cnuella takakiae]SHF69560.1 Glycosyl transferase family 2 [Cnuella takakiae]